jgi:CheY-like chemotaxis protein
LVEGDFVPVVAVTAYDDSETVETCIKIGMSEVLNKPVNMFKLDKTI